MIYVQGMGTKPGGLKRYGRMVKARAFSANPQKEYE